MPDDTKPAPPTDEDSANPGQVFTPGAAPQAEQQTPSPPPTAQAFEQPQNSPESAPTPYVEDVQVASGDTITWTASEYVAHEKSTGWYTNLALASVALAALLYLLTRDVVSVGVVVVGAIALGVYGARQPRQLQYQIDPHGISIGAKHFGFNEFRSFAIIPEGAFSSIVFVPLKRFAALTTIYYAPEDEDKIASILAERLPFEERKSDAVDQLMRRIRF